MSKAAHTRLRLVAGSGAGLARRAGMAGVAAAVPAGPTPVRAQLAHRLRATITEGTYRPSDRVTERELCERFQVSRPSLREALRQLEAEGLVDILPNRGAVVRTVTLEDVLELWEVRLCLEILIARRFAVLGSERQVAAFEQAIRSFESALKAKDVSFIKSEKNRLFEAFAAGAGSAIIAGYFTQVSARLSFLWSSSLLIPGRPAESIGELAALLSAIRTRNPAAAEAAVVLHNEHAKAIAMHGLRAFEESKARSCRKPRAGPPTIETTRRVKP